MEEAILKLLTGNPEPRQIAAGVVVLLLAIVPKILSIRDTWTGYRQNLGKIKHQREMLEILKLQYEIEALRKQHNLEEIIPLGAVETTKNKIDKKKKAPSPVWKTMVRHPIAGEIALRILQGFAGLYLIVFALGSIAMPFVYISGNETTLDTGEEMDPVIMAIGWLFYIVLTYLLYKGFVGVKNLIRDLRTEVDLQQDP